MIAAFGTLAFVATLWLLGVVAAATLEDSGAKIAAALKGRSFASEPRQVASIRFRGRTRAVQPMRAEPRWRDAA